MKRILYWMILPAALALLGLQDLAAQVPPGDIPLVVGGEGVKTITIVEKLPFTITAPTGAGYYAWYIPNNVTAVRLGNVLRVTGAPKGDISINVDSVSVDFDAKKFIVKQGSVTVSVGSPTPPGPLPPDPPIPPDPPPAGVMASFIEGITDNENRSQQIASIVTDKSLKDWFEANKIGWRVFDVASAQTYGATKILADQGVKAPAIIGWWNGKPKAFGAPQNVEGVKKFASGQSLQRVFHNPDKNLRYYQSPKDEHKRWLTRLPPAKKYAVAGFKESVGLIPESQWKDISRRASFDVSWIMDQDGHGSCVGHGATAALERVRSGGGMLRQKLSPTCCYAQINGGSDNGAVIGDSLNAMQQVGTVLFSTFGESKIYESQLPSGWKTEAARFKIEQAYGTPTSAEIASSIQLGYVAVFGMEVGNNFESFDKYGVAGFASGYGNHCLMIDGMVKLADGRWVFDVVNSWSGDWGPWQNGRCYMTFTHIDRADNSDAYAIRTATEDPQEKIRPPMVAVIDRKSAGIELFRPGMSNIEKLLAIAPSIREVSR